MSDSVLQDGESREGVSTSWATAGVLLRQARVSAGVHVDALAAALKVPVYKVQALEEDRLDAFPDVVFVRALASSICRTLKVDAAPILELLPQGQQPQLSISKGLNAAFKDGGSKKSGGAASLGSASFAGSRWIFVIVVLLLLAAVAVVFVPRGWTPWPEGFSTSAPSSDKPVPAGHVAEAPVVVQVPSPSVEAAGQAAEGGAMAPVAGASTADRPSSVPQESSPPSLVASPTMSDVLVIRARGETWVQVRSSSGASLQRVLQAGENLVAPGAPPWAVVIGKAAVTEVLVRGEPLDLSTVARENVARFEVK